MARVYSSSTHVVHKLSTVKQPVDIQSRTLRLCVMCAERNGHTCIVSEREHRHLGYASASSVDALGTRHALDHKPVLFPPQDVLFS